MKSKFIILSLLMGGTSLFAQVNHWQELKNKNYQPTNLVERSTVPKEFKLLAWDEDKEIMAIKHEKHDLYGVQFHPESFMTKHGDKIISNFLKI